MDIKLQWEDCRFLEMYDKTIGKNYANYDFKYSFSKRFREYCTNGRDIPVWSIYEEDNYGN